MNARLFCGTASLLPIGFHEGAQQQQCGQPYVERKAFSHTKFNWHTHFAFVFFSLPLFLSASDRIHWICPLVLRNSSAAQASIADIDSPSMRRMKFLVVVSFLAMRLNYHIPSSISVNCLSLPLLSNLRIPFGSTFAPYEIWELSLYIRNAS